MKLATLATLLTIALAAVADAKHHKKHHKHQNNIIRGDNDSGHHLGLPWGCDPSCIKGLKSTKRFDLNWYHHWQDTSVPDLDKLGLEYVPTFWGPSKWDKWNNVKSEIYQSGNWPSHMLFVNEPDVQGQSDVGPQAAAQLWMQEMKPFADRGVKVGSAQVCWNMQWLQSFMSECKKLGCDISFIALHWYGSWRDFDKFTNWISTVHNEFGLPIWITEYGITQASGGTQAQIKAFHIRAVAWMKAQGYVKRSAWLGGFPVDQKPDPYPSNLNSYFNGDGSARDLLWWASQAGGGSFLSIPGLHRRDETIPGKDYKDDEPKKSPHPQYDEEHCDYKCQLRENSVEKHARKKKGIVAVNDKQVCVETPGKLDKDERKKLTSCFREVGLLKKDEHIKVKHNEQDVKADSQDQEVHLNKDNKHPKVGTPKQTSAKVESA